MTVLIAGLGQRVQFAVLQACFKILRAAESRAALQAAMRLFWLTGL